ncbi:uncharacterized protein N7459_009700 [Penicillium hispanicum]|uniref:uncharacterized protein n=1 Tax=Penicillium hispanicum TaxID=1080232 RepID=UPI0025422BB0|nr:uncharacterized protein N7459_009700 [Penicillium hispanicum]KAJ5570270.1 hypothetical protein N7459_009700 [Penicillium hispanicum]
MPASVHSEDPQDQSMIDAEQPQGQEQLEQQEQEEEQDPFMLDEKRIVVVRNSYLKAFRLSQDTIITEFELPGSTETAASFQFESEGHTMGNALRFAIMKKLFCGYTIPHPSDAKMHLRIQTTDSTTALEALEKGFDDLMDLCDVVSDKFTVARDQFNEENSNRMQA